MWSTELFKFFCVSMIGTLVRKLFALKEQNTQKKFNQPNQPMGLRWKPHDNNLGGLKTDEDKEVSHDGGASLCTAGYWVLILGLVWWIYIYTSFQNCCFLVWCLGSKEVSVGTHYTVCSDIGCEGTHRIQLSKTC